MVLWLYTGQLGLQDQMVDNEITTCRPAGFTTDKKSNIKIMAFNHILKITKALRWTFIEIKHLFVCSNLWHSLSELNLKKQVSCKSFASM